MFPLFSLPLELRLIIYRFLFNSDPVSLFPSPDVSATPQALIARLLTYHIYNKALLALKCEAFFNLYFLANHYSDISDDKPGCGLLETVQILQIRVEDRQETAKPMPTAGIVRVFRIDHGLLRWHKSFVERSSRSIPDSLLALMKDGCGLADGEEA